MPGFTSFSARAPSGNNASPCANILTSKGANQTQAYIDAGFSRNGARFNASKLLTKDHVRAALDGGRRAREAKALVEAVQVLHELRPLAHSNISHYIVDDDGQVQLAKGAPANALAAVESVERHEIHDKDGTLIKVRVKIRLWNKPKCLELEGAHHGLWKPAADPDAPAAALFVIRKAPDFIGTTLPPSAQRFLK